jgi:Oligopeptidase F
VQERVTATSTRLLFFTLEFNRLDDAKLEAAMQDPALAHHRPWIEDSARTSPFNQLEDRVEQLFIQSGWKGRTPPIWRVLLEISFSVRAFSLGLAGLLPLLPGLLALLLKYAYAQTGKNSVAPANIFFKRDWL